MTGERRVEALRALVFLAGAVAVVLLPRFVGDFRALELALVPIYLTALLGLNIVTGFSGQISLGHGALMALGGYTTAILISNQGLKIGIDLWRIDLGPHTFANDVKDLWTIPLAGVVAGVAGAIFGVVAGRLRGLYLALVTFGVAVALPPVLKKFAGLTGGSSGIQLFDLEQYTGRGYLPVSVLGREQTFNDYIYYLCWGVAGAMLVLAWLFLRGRIGRALRAVRDSEVAASSYGVGLGAYKSLAFAVSAFFAGVAGSLYALHTTFVNPDVFPIQLSIFLLVGAVIGGLGSLGSLVVGAVFIVYLPKLAGALAGREELPATLKGWLGSPGTPSIVFGVSLILVAMLLPGGAGGLLRRFFSPLTTRLYTRREDDSAATTGALREGSPL